MKQLLKGTAALLMLLLVCGMAFAQEMQRDPNSNPGNLAPQSVPTKPNQMMLQGGVSSYADALQEERGIVDWYAWYLSLREYMINSGGIKCDTGTSLRIYRSGTMQAVSQDPVCIMWVSTKRFPLPKGTRLETVILPVRDRGQDPASPSEIMHRTNGGK